MSVTRVGATKKYSDNWENIFGGKRRSSTKTKSAKSAKPSGRRKTAKKKAGKKSARRR